MVAELNGITTDAVVAEAQRRHEVVGVTELTATYQVMQTDAAHRRKHGINYTPEPLARFISRFGLDLGLGQVGPEPDQVLRIVAADPSCGCGPFLVQAARQLACAYADRVFGADAPPQYVAAALPLVIMECVFGIDIDPVAVELARIALSIETEGRLAPADLERNVVCGNPLEGDEPPAMRDRMANAAA